MSVLVRGMEMPKGCFFCPMRIKIDPDTIRCLATGNDFEETFAGTIERRNNGNCPLVEVKEPHGRLIDADFEERHYTSMTVNPTPDVTDKDKRNSLIIIEALQMAKTVVEAEGGNE